MRGRRRRFLVLGSKELLEEASFALEWLVGDVLDRVLELVVELLALVRGNKRVDDLPDQRLAIVVVPEGVLQGDELVVEEGRVGNFVVVNAFAEELELGIEVVVVE